MVSQEVASSCIATYEGRVVSGTLSTVTLHSSELSLKELFTSTLKLLNEQR